MAEESRLKQRLQTQLVADLMVRGLEENEAAKAVYNEVLEVLWPLVEQVEARLGQAEGVIACALADHEGWKAEAMSLLVSSTDYVEVEIGRDKRL